MKYWMGTKNGHRQDDLADERQGLGRVAAVEPVVVAADERQDDQDADAADGADQASAEGVEVVLLLQEEVAEHGSGEEAETHGREADEAHLDGTDAHDSGEGGLQGRRDRLRVLDHLAEHVELLVLPPRVARATGRR